MHTSGDGPAERRVRRTETDVQRWASGELGSLGDEEGAVERGTRHGRGSRGVVRGETKKERAVAGKEGYIEGGRVKGRDKHGQGVGCCRRMSPPCPDLATRPLASHQTNGRPFLSASSP